MTLHVDGKLILAPKGKSMCVCVIPFSLSLFPLTFLSLSSSSEVGRESDEDPSDVHRPLHPLRLSALRGVAGRHL